MFVQQLGRVPSGCKRVPLEKHGKTYMYSHVSACSQANAWLTEASHSGSQPQPATGGCGQVHPGAALGGNVQQSPDMGDLLLHETAVAWFRKRMRAERPEVVPWEETPVQWTKRARKVVASINQEYDVAGLCREFPQRLRDVVNSEGERLRK